MAKQGRSLSDLQGAHTLPAAVTEASGRVDLTHEIMGELVLPPNASRSAVACDRVDVLHAERDGGSRVVVGDEAVKGDFPLDLQWLMVTGHAGRGHGLAPAVACPPQP